MLLAHDTDPFNRWEAGQRLALQPPGRGASRAGQPRCSSTTPSWRPCAAVLRHPTLDAAFKELVLTLPARAYIAEQLDVVDPQRIHAVREAHAARSWRSALHADWELGLRGAPGDSERLRARPGVRPAAARWPTWRCAMLCLARGAQRRHGVAGHAPTSASRTPAT